MVSTLERRELIRPGIEVNPKAEEIRIDGRIIYVLPLNGSRALISENLASVVGNIRDAAVDESGKEITVTPAALRRAAIGDFAEDELIKNLIGSSVLDGRGVEANRVDFFMSGRHFTAALINTTPISEIPYPTVCVIYDHPETP